MAKRERTKEERTKARKKSRIAFTISGVFIVLAVLGAGWLFSMQQAANPSPSGSGFLSVSDEEEVDDDGFPVVDWDYWLSVNPDIIGWVTVPGTNISQPIVQASSDDPTYYLKHDVYGNYNIYGCPYLDADCAEDGLDSLNAVIFGHHISDGSMFATFASYSSQSFAEEHQIILLQTPDSKRILQVNFSRVINASKIMKQVSFEDDAAYQAWYLSELEEAAVVVDHSSVPTANTTFVTCSYNRFSNERTLVYASVSVIYSVE